MKLLPKSLVPACLATVASLAVHAEPAGSTADVFTKTERLDKAMLQRRMNLGYSQEEIEKYFDIPLVYEFDKTGMAPGLIKAPPAPGVHPRVLFYQEDLPALRKKLAETKPGKLQMNAIRAACTELITGSNARYGKLYADAVQGVGSKALTETEPACAIEYECFRSLIDEDAAGARKAAAALLTLAREEGKLLDARFVISDKAAASPHAPVSPGRGPAPDMYAPGVKPPRNYMETKNMTQAGLLGLAYDIAYPSMTEAQRDGVREVIAKATANMAPLGSDNLHAFPATTSNWIPMHLPLTLMTLSIEGEKGYDPTTYERCVSAYKGYLGAGLFPAGDMFESMGKNFICTEYLVPIANRGEPLLALSKLRRQIDYYYLHAMDPWGGNFTFYDSLGGRGNVTPMYDVMVEKYFFPNDPAIDYVYRNTVGDDYAFYGGKLHFSHPLYLLRGIVKAVFGVPYDESKDLKQAREAATKDKPLTFFSEDTGNMIALSSWNEDATQLHFLTRSVAGGHIYCDRTHFSVHALGRYWGIYKPLRQIEEHYLPKNRSVILVDGTGPGMAPAKCVDMQDTADASFVAADALSSYKWTTGGNERFPRGGVRVPYCANDFRLHKSPLPWMNMPYSDLPFWGSSTKGSELWLPYSEMKMAFRSAGLVRGKHPYVLVFDDIQKDEAEHAYNWGMILEDDLVQGETVVTTDTAGFRNDVIIEAPNDPRKLLVRILQADGQVDPKAPATIEKFTLANPPKKEIEIHRLAVNSNAVNPHFKTLLFPYQAGAELPNTTWNAAHNQLSITWSDQADIVTFTPGADGRCRYTIARDRTPLVSMK